MRPLFSSLASFTFSILKDFFYILFVVKDYLVNRLTKKLLQLPAAFLRFPEGSVPVLVQWGGRGGTVCVCVCALL